MYPYRIVFPNSAPDTSRAAAQTARVSGASMAAAQATVLWNVVIAAASILVLYALSFGPAWGLYKRGRVFSKCGIRFIYTPLVNVAAQHLCPLGLPEQLPWRYAELFAPAANPKALSADDTFD
jgi:hypothetical protein